MKKQENRDKKHSIKNIKGGVIPLLGVSLIIFVLTVAVYFVANYVAESYAEDTRLSGWNYLYTDKAGVIPDGELRIYNAQNPIVTENKARKSNIYLTKSVEPSDKKLTVMMITDYAPMKIRVNGRDIYNNQFEAEDYVGNCYNAITLEPSTHDRQIEVFMKLPFSVRFEAYLKESGNASFTPNRSFYFGCILAGIGILAILAFCMLSLIRKRFFRSLLTSIIAAYTGAAIILHSLPEITYALNAPIFLRLTELPVHLTFMLTMWFVSRQFKNNGKTAVAILFAAGISAALSLAALTPLMVKMSSAVMSLLCIAAIVYSSQTALIRLEHRTQYAVPIFVICSYYALIAVFAAILLVTRQRVLYMYNVAISTFVVAGVMEYIYIAEYRFEMKNKELRTQSARYEASVEQVSQFIQHMLSSSKEDLFETAANEISALIKQFYPEGGEIKCCAAVKADDGYREILNRGVIGCSYDIIAECCGSDKNCVFAQTYFDCILRSGDEVAAVFHFENITDGLDVFFNSMMETAYCGLETTYENLFISKATRDVNIIFAELAENTELENGCSVEHLTHIYEYARALCIKLGMDEEKAEHIATAAKLHDLGKIAVPKYIIQKQGRLSEDERIIINSHTEFGYTILAAYTSDPLLATASTVARYHHERYDGAGTYGLKGEDIPIEARIITVCDVYDALVSERSYKKAWDAEDALNYLKENEGKIFDPVICEAFLAYINDPEENEGSSAGDKSGDKNEN